jgi:hypothetical protein
LQPLPQPLLQQRLLQQRSLQQLDEQHLDSQPQPQPPSMASSSSKPKLWVQTARASTNDPRSVVRFIERRLLNDGTIELAQSPVRPDHAAKIDALDSAAVPSCVGPVPPGSPIAGANLSGVRLRVGQVCGKAGVVVPHGKRCRPPEPVRAVSGPKLSAPVQPHAAKHSPSWRGLTASSDTYPIVAKFRLP